MPSVFLSYSHKDEVWKDRLQKHLGVLQAEGLLDVWDDRRIAAGDTWLPEIESAIERASVAVLLVSADFLTSKFILGKEVFRFLERRASEKTTVFPVIIHPCTWKQVNWLTRLQIRPADGRALSSYRGHRVDEELTKISEEILNLASPDRFDYLARDSRVIQDDFLSRVETVLRLREPKAQVERTRGNGAAGDYLRVCRHTGEFATFFPIGAIEQGLSETSFRTFLDEVDASYRRNDPQLVSILVYGGEGAPAPLVQLAKENRVHLQSFIEFQGLIDFRSYVEKQTETLDRDPVYPPRLYVPQRMRFPSGRDEQETSDTLATVQEWLSSPAGRFIVILGDFGTGKTFLLHELARRMGTQNGGLIPILLQMRSLEKGRDLNALLAQHFALEGVEDFSPGRFRYMLEQGRVALLFDGFDELALRVTYDRATEHFDTLLQAATGAAKVVLTSRRQHFVSDQQVKTVLAERAESVPGNRLAILQPFDRNQIRTFLLNFCGHEASADKRLQLIDHVRDLLGLSHNPRLLGFIAELSEEQLLAASSGDGEITAAGLYQLLLERWLVGEFERVHPKGAPPGLSIEDRWRAVTSLALRLWQKTDPFVGLSELTEDAARVIEALDPSLAAFQLGSGTLLVRDEDGNFSFLHQSVLEWLVARDAAEELKLARSPESLAAREMSPLMADFLGSLATRQIATDWARDVLAASATEAAKRNALLILERLGEAARDVAHLAGQNLRGKDLSYQDLTGADLTGADLAGARLVGTCLKAAFLVDTKFAGADLSGADLSGTELSGADFSGARLLGADLQGARLVGTTLRHAKLLATAPGPRIFEDCDTFGAALALPSFLDGLTGWANVVRAVAWSPDGALLATAEGCVVRLWEASSGREIRRFKGHDNWISSLAFSRDGLLLASGSSDNTVRLWQVSSGSEIRQLQGHEDWVFSVAFSPDGQIIASASEDKTVRLWQTSSGREVRRLKGHQYSVFSVAFSPDGQKIATGSSDKTARLWQVSSGSEIKRLQGHDHSIFSVAFSPDGQKIATGAGDGTIRLWEVSSGVEIRQFQGHGYRVLSVAFSPDGQSLASASAASIRLWQVSSYSEPRRLLGHHGHVLSIAFSPDGQSIASGWEDKTARLWQVSSGREIRRLQGYDHSVLDVAFSPDGQSLASGSSDKTVRLWQISSSSEIRRLQGSNSISSVAFSRDGRNLVAGSFETVRLWEISSGSEIQQFIGHSNSVLSVACSPDGQSLASGSEDRTVRLWQISSGKEIRLLRGHDYRVLSVAFSPDGQYLASSSFDRTVRLWQISSGREVRCLHGHNGFVSSVAFSPDGQSLASGSEDRTVRLWQVSSGKRDQRFRRHDDSVLSIAWSPNGQYLASGSEDRTIRLWQIASGKEIRRFLGHENSVSSVAFSPDGQYLASGSSDNTIRLWNVTAGTCLAILAPLPEGWVAFSPDGRYKLGGIPAGGFWHVINLCRFEAGELDEWVPGLRLPDESSFFDLPPWKAELRRPERLDRDRRADVAR